jgi:hypothetical protein
MKTIEDILKITLSSIDNNEDFTSLCVQNNFLKNYNLLSDEEIEKLNGECRKNIKKSTYFLEYLFKPNVRQYNKGLKDYWWPKEKKWYRKRFLKYLLKNIKKQENEGKI